MPNVPTLRHVLYEYNLAKKEQIIDEDLTLVSEESVVYASLECPNTRFVPPILLFIILVATHLPNAVVEFQ